MELPGAPFKVSRSRFWMTTFFTRSGQLIVPEPVYCTTFSAAPILVSPDFQLQLT